MFAVMFPGLMLRALVSRVECCVWGHVSRGWCFGFGFCCLCCVKDCVPCREEIFFLCWVGFACAGAVGLWVCCVRDCVC